MICCSCHGLHGWVPVAPSARSRSATSPKRRLRRSRWRSSASAKSSPFPERISISEEISSPATESHSTSSSSDAAWTRSKAFVMESVRESSSANSSSSPTVKSWDDSKIAWAAPASKPWDEPSTVIGGPLGQIEVERVEKVHRWTRRVDRDVGRHLEQRVGVVEDDAHARFDEVVGGRLGGRRGDRKHADHDVLLLDDLPHHGVGPHHQLADPAPDLLLVDVEDRDDPESVVGEDVRAGDRLAEVARAEQRDVVLARGPQDLADLREERVDVVAD